MNNKLVEEGVQRSREAEARATNDCNTRRKKAIKEASEILKEREIWN